MKPFVLRIATEDADLIRRLASDPSITSAQLHPTEATEAHKYKVGDTCILDRLTTFPEYNGEEVVIENVREDGDHGRCYYIRGRINEVLNWVYEDRMKPKANNG